MSPVGVSSTGTICWCSTAPTSAIVSGITTAVARLPAVGKYRSSRSGVTSSRQPGAPCGRIAASGCASVPRPRTEIARPFAGMPVASERNTPPTNGSAVAVSTLAPPAPLQPAPNATAVAGHGVVSSASFPATWPLASVKLPTSTRRPSACAPIAATVSLQPLPTAPQTLPFQRATRLPLAPANAPPASTSPSGSTSRLVTWPGRPLPSGDQAKLLQRAMLLAATRPTTVNAPPTSRSPFGNAASAATGPATPPLTLNHALPFQRPRL